jgi:hypothetical protein
MKVVNKKLKELFGVDSLILSTYNYQLTLNQLAIKNNNLDRKKIISWIIEYYAKLDGIARVFELEELMATPLNSTIKDRIANGYFPKRSGDIQLVYLPGWINILVQHMAYGTLMIAIFLYYGMVGALKKAILIEKCT